MRTRTSSLVHSVSHCFETHSPSRLIQQCLILAHALRIPKCDRKSFGVAVNGETMQRSTSSIHSLCSLGLCRKRKGRLRPRAGAHSDIGLRETNDDLVFAGEHCRLYVALDGIGGHAGGEAASRIVLEQLRANIESMCESAGDHLDQDLKQAVSHAIADARAEMLKVAQETPEYDSMGTVFSLAYVVDGTLLYTHVGDARVYLYREGKTRQLTTDETYVQLMVDVGVIKPSDIPEHPMRNIVLNAVGTRPGAPPALVHAKTLLPGDVVLLTTDGVSDKLSAEEFSTLLSVDQHPSTIAKAVVKAALDAGTNDNASCVVVRIDRSDDVVADEHDELHAELTKLHEMLGNVEELDDELRTDLQKIAEDIRNALQEEGPSDLQGLRKELSDRALKFEVSHPHLTNAVASIANLLSSMGI